MTLPLTAERPPLTEDEHGAIRVTGTRVSLEMVVSAFQSGMTAEEIAGRFDTLDLADVFGVLRYYLRHRTEVDAYMIRRDAEAVELRRTIEAGQKPFPSREELFARKAARDGQPHPRR